METKIATSADTSIIVIYENQLLGIENESFQTIVKNSIKQGSKNILVDLSNVKFISSWGIEGFLHAFKTCTNNDIKFKLINVNDAVKDVLATLKLNKVFNII